jgi:anti-sigma-K factor RskA
MTPDDQLLDYVLGLLGPDEVRLLEAQLALNPLRRAQVRALRDSMLVMVDDLPALPPPPEAFAQLEAKFKTLRDANHAPINTPQMPAPSRSRSRPSSWSRFRSIRPLILVVSSLAVIAALLWGANNWRILGREQPSLSAYLNDPSVRKLVLKNQDGTPTGQVLLREDGRMLISMKTALPPGKVFQAWGVTGPANKRIASPIGLGDGQQLEVSRGRFPILWISIEPLGGSAQPTRKVGRVKLG